MEKKQVRLNPHVNRAYDLYSKGNKVSFSSFITALSLLYINVEYDLNILQTMIEEQQTEIKELQAEITHHRTAIHAFKTVEKYFHSYNTFKDLNPLKPIHKPNSLNFYPQSPPSRLAPKKP